MGLRAAQHDLLAAAPVRVEVSDVDCDGQLSTLFLTVLTLAGKLTIGGNKGCFNTAGFVSAGDFDGNGTQDVFQAVGTTWMWSPSGRREWQFLLDSGRVGPGLKIGDFDGDGKDDVLRHAAFDAPPLCVFWPGVIDRFTLASGLGIVRTWSTQNML